MGRMTRTARRLMAILAVSAVWLGSAAPAAALLVWSLSPTVVTATAGQMTTVSFTVTNLDVFGRNLGCVEIDLPASYTSISASVGNASNGDEWDTSIAGSSVVVFSQSGGGELEGPLGGGLLGESVTFTVRMVPTVGAATWPNHAHQSHNCDATEEVGVPIVATVLPSLLPTPTPVATPKPTPQPTSTPAPTLPLPIPLPSVPLPSLPVPSIGLPPIGATPTPAPTPRSSTPTPRATEPATASASASPIPSRSAAPTAGAGVPVGSPPSAGGRTDDESGVAAPTVARDAPRLNFDPAELDIDFESSGLLNGTTVWLVPTATFAIPAVLLLLFVALQAIGALAWVPAVRRLSGRDDEVA